MFELITDKLDGIFRKLSGRGFLSEKNIQEAGKEIRLALLEADVNYKVVKNFVAEIEKKAVGQEVTKSITPGQQFIKIVSDEMVALLGGDKAELFLPLPHRRLSSWRGFKAQARRHWQASWRWRYAKRGIVPCW